MNKYLALIAICALSFTSSCRSESEGSDAHGANPASETIREALNRTRAGTGRAILTVTYEESENLTSTDTTTADFHGPAWRSTTTFGDEFDPTNVPVLLIDGMTYTDVTMLASDGFSAPGIKWLSAEAGPPSNPQDKAPWLYIGQPTTVFPDTDELEAVGDEVIGGDSTTHYSTTIAPEVLLDFDERASDALVAATRRYANTHASVEVDVWLDADSLVRRLQVNLQSTISDEFAGCTALRPLAPIQLHLEFDDIGQDIEIEKPAPETVMDFNEFVGIPPDGSSGAFYLGETLESDNGPILSFFMFEDLYLAADDLGLTHPEIEQMDDSAGLEAYNRLLTYWEENPNAESLERSDTVLRVAPELLCPES